MRIFLYDVHNFEREHFSKANTFGHEMTFYEARLNEKSAILAKSYPCVCAFVNDRLNESVLKILAENGTKLVALRSAGYNNVDLKAAEKLRLKVVRVPEYSPYAVAEHAVGLLLTLNRKFHKAYNRVREGNFSLEGLVGFDLHGKTVGVIGTGKIGKVFIKILKGFGCQVLAFDLNPDQDFARENQISYTSLDEIYSRADIISLHLPLSDKTRHMINRENLKKMKDGVILINTGRGGLVDTEALIESLKNGHLGGAGLDVYEEEENYFFQDLSSKILDDDLLARLMTFPNVILTGHQGFLTEEALTNIAQTTLNNISDFENQRTLRNEVRI
ncbi:MAG: 2-hydroxyacid dehydrogenase [Bacteriovoracaceae bacterium]